MVKRNKLLKAKQLIENLLDNSIQKAYSLSDLRKVILESRDSLNLPKSKSNLEIINFLLENSKLKKIELDFPSYPTNRYVWGDLNLDLIFQIALSIKPDSYLSHYSAMFLNDLTEQIPKNIYVNFEQIPRNQNNTVELTQGAISRAFQNNVRQSKNTVSFENYKITVINGKCTNKTGVIKLIEKDGTEIAVTDLERTIIDITVRPIYSGGVHEVLNAYRLGKDRISVNRIKAYLKKINYIYPYHQAIGFYLEMAGYPEKRLKLLEKNDIKYDFYLTHKMTNTNYSSRWRIYYPKSL